MVPEGTIGGGRMDTKQRIAAASERVASLEVEKRGLLDRLAEIQGEIEGELVVWLPAWFDDCARQEVQRNHDSAQSAGIGALEGLKQDLVALKSEAGSIVRDSFDAVEWPHLGETAAAGFRTWTVPHGPAASYEVPTASNQLPSELERAVLRMCAHLRPALVGAEIVRPVQDKPGHGGAPWREHDGQLRFYDSAAGRGPAAEVPKAVQRSATDYVETLKSLRINDQHTREAVQEFEQAKALLLFEEA
jgi:hypothetical protein